MNDIPNRTPIDKTAALVTSKGIRYKSPKNIQTAHSEIQPGTVEWTPKRLDADQTGVRVGRLTVIGISVSTLGRWVMRCSCGMYTLRKAKTIKNKANKYDCCETCRELLYLKRKHHYKLTGETKDWSYFF